RASRRRRPGGGAPAARRAPGAARPPRFPRLEVTVFEEPNPTELERLARGGVIDLALMAGPCEEGLYDGHHLGDEEFVVVLPAGHPALAADRVGLRELEREPWVRFDTASALDGVLVDVLRDNGLAPATVARVSQTATAVRWAVHGLGVTFVPASAVPPGHEHLVRPVSPAVSQPVVAAVRPGAGPAETALLEFLRQETWYRFGQSWVAPPSATSSAPVV
ncbi:LysR family transcriptional regulator substrate-binding protein, partial [Streptomyces sp. NPDC059409]|uniref:LysR family transcriptional regulator substrate-binding protein n=1 Tax=Streptomyces sp. NPDC059409 TaxID=3346824 RepID=UPI003699536F